MTTVSHTTTTAPPPALDEEDDSMFASVGIMFEGSQPTTLKHFSWKKKNGTTTTGSTDDADDTGDCDDNSKNANRTIPDPHDTIHISLNVVDDNPGALQSGHYLWPASTALCDYLVQTFHAKDCSKIGTVLELGAGCALASLTALQLFSKALQWVVVTDHDPGTLQRARENHETTLEDLYERAETEQEQMDFIINDLGSIPVKFEFLEWGNEQSIRELLDDLSEYTNDHTMHFDLVLGSDLIYCCQVVEPLLRTAALFMKRHRNDEKPSACPSSPSSSSSSSVNCRSPQFLLSQSFPYDDETEIEIDSVAEKLNLERIIHVDELSKTGGTRIQEFRPR